MRIKIYRNMIFPNAVTPNKESRLTVVENRVMGKVLGGTRRTKQECGETAYRWDSRQILLVKLSPGRPHEKDKTGGECDTQGTEHNAIQRLVGKPEENYPQDLA